MRSGTPPVSVLVISLEDLSASPLDTMPATVWGLGPLYTTLMKNGTGSILRSLWTAFSQFLICEAGREPLHAPPRAAAVYWGLRNDEILAPAQSMAVAGPHQLTCR